MTSLISAVVTCRSGVEPDTRTCSERPARPRVRSSARVRPISSTTVSVRGAKPANSALISHVPTRSAGRKKRPAAVGDPFDDEPGIRVARRDRDARQHASNRIAHDARNFAGVRLCGRGPAGDNHNQVRQQRAADRSDVIA